jgi:hypothetical protein
MSVYDKYPVTSLHIYDSFAHTCVRMGFDESHKPIIDYCSYCAEPIVGYNNGFCSANCSMSHYD